MLQSQICQNKPYFVASKKCGIRKCSNFEQKLFSLRYHSSVITRYNEPLKNAEPQRHEEKYSKVILMVVPGLWVKADCTQEHHLIISTKCRLVT